MPDTIRLKIKRQDNPQSSPYYEEFEIAYRPNMNVISCLMEIQKNPVTRDGRKTSPVAWEASCLEEVCGSCTILMNGRVGQACSALIDRLGRSITLEPMSKFPVVRDLIVNRQAMFDRLIKIRDWIPIDGTYDLGPGPRIDHETQELRYRLSRCMSCGCCMEACPQFNQHSAFLGPAILNQVYLHNLHPTGAMNKDERLQAIMGDGGITDCGKAQNCVQVCPKEIPLTIAINALFRETTWHGLFGWLKS